LLNFSQFLEAAHISTVNCDEMAEDRPRQPAYVTFSIERRFSLSKSRPLRFKEACAGAQVCVKDGYPPKNGHFTTTGWCSVKTVAVTSFLVMSTSMTLNDFEIPK